MYRTLLKIMYMIQTTLRIKDSLSHHRFLSRRYENINKKLYYEWVPSLGDRLAPTKQNRENAMKLQTPSTKMQPRKIETKDHVQFKFL